ncbi:MAG: hypothetical protein PHH13_02695 [Candidatus Peribacteraceae bacterium]|nr:hypothetical protein [Candidatus Peribacteraceae bacterium]
MEDALAQAFLAHRDSIEPNTPSLKEPFDLLSELQRTRSALQGLLPSAGTDEEIPQERLEAAIHMLGLSEQTIQEVSNACRTHCGATLRLTEADARTFDQQRGRQTIRDLYEGDPWAMDGAKFLEEMFSRNERWARLRKPDRPQIARLEHMVTETFGEQYGPLVYVLFNFMDQDMPQLAALTETQCRFHSASVSAAEPRSITESSAQQAAAIFRERWQNPAVCTDAPDPPHFFEHLGHFLRVFGDVSAYVIEHTEETMYGRYGGRFPHSVQEAERRSLGALKKVLSHPVLQTNAAASVDLLETLAAECRKDPTSHPWLFWGNLHATPLSMAFVDDLLSLEMPRSVLAETCVALNTLTTSPHIPDEVAVRILDPVKLLTDPEMTHYADRLFARLQHLPKKNEQETWRQPVLRRSLQIALHRDDPSRLLDMPLQSGRYRDWTIRDLLMRACFARFPDAQIILDEEIVLKGEPPDRRTLFPLVEPLRMHTPPTQHRLNFNSAGVGTVRDHFTEAASKALSLQRGTRRFEWAISYTQRALDTYYATGRNYEYFLFGSATTAFEWFLLQQFPHLREGNNIVMTNQEYDLLPRYFLERCGETGVRPVALRHPSEERLRTDEELLAAIEEVMDPQTLMVLISSKTRYGDAPCSRPRGDRPNTYYLQRLIAKLKERHPTTLVTLDGAQSIGRAVPEYQLLGADLFLGSSAKALGTGEAGFIALRNELAASVGYQPSMLPLDHIVAMGMALNNHDAPRHDLRRMEGNVGEQGKHEGWYNIARRMRHLTMCALQQAKDYGQNVLQLLQNNDAHGLKKRLRETEARLGEAGLKRLFGCEVLSPYHCNQRDLAGILTLLSPNVKGEQMAQDLARWYPGTQVLPCRNRNRALRISFDYCHSAEDVEELFEAMAETHCCIAAQAVLDGKPWREVYDLNAPPTS